MKKDPKKNPPTALTAPDYIFPNEDNQDNQLAAARRQFIEAVSRVVPDFLQRLRDDVYPEYARFANHDPQYWVTGSSFADWQLRSDRDSQFTPVLTAWAEKFNVHVDWILEGALQTLSSWHQFPARRTATDISGFWQWYAGPLIISAEEQQFSFSNWGCDPTLFSFAGWRAGVRKRFEAALDDYEDRIRKLVEDRGAVPTIAKFSEQHFEWLARYQCGNVPLDVIQKSAPHVGDKTTISKGIRTAATLAGIAVRPRRRKSG